jgi:epoxyqueuosine reductase
LKSSTKKQSVKAIATQLGFEQCGIARAVALPDDARRLENWLQKGMHGSMHYMANYFDLRTDPRKLVPGAQSVITLLLNYYPPAQQVTHAPKIARYAWGEDYHTVIREKLNQLLQALIAQFGQINGRGFVDSAPVLERTWAQRSGLGWIGKNGNLLNKKMGSYFFIATLITDLEIEPDEPYLKDFCGTCTRCIDACPTQAILPNKVVDGSRCIAYYTIELKELIMPSHANGKTDNWLFGCDVCQEVCPWNRFSQPGNELRFTPLPQILNFTTRQWDELTEEAFKTIFKKSPLKRCKYTGIKRNLKMIAP